MLGLITSKADLEDPDTIKARIQGSRPVHSRSTACACPPRCGFALHQEGTKLTETSSGPRSLIQSIAKDVWGE